MPAQKQETFSFGGVDSRSNPANFPATRSIRSINFTPQASGALRLRAGYTVPSGPTADTIPIHSAVYYEQFSAAYLGPQYVLYGKGAAIDLLNMDTGAISTIGQFGSSNPWGHFRANNRIFMGAGGSSYPNTNFTAAWAQSDLQSWDGTTMRPAGLPALAAALVADASAYASSATVTGVSGTTWSNPSNAEGAPDGAYATAIINDATETMNLRLTAYGFSIPTTSTVTGVAVTITGYCDTGLRALPAQMEIGLNNTLSSIAPAHAIYLPTATAEASVTVGSSSDTWGYYGLDPTDVNSPNFGINLLVRGTDSSRNSEVFLDAAQITVYYALANGIVVSQTSSSNGSIAPTQLTGYQLAAAIYNPITQHMGNYASIGTLQTVGATATAFVVSGLPALSAYDSEWEYALGMTDDGGQVPYWFVDANGNNIVIGNSGTMGTIYIGNLNAQQALPVLNSPPPPLDKFANVGGIIFGGLAGNPYLSYSNAASDISNADYVGVPFESWPANQQEPLPTGELPTSIHAYQLEGWFFSRNNLCIWSAFLLQQGVNPWRGPWPGGCVAQRAFVETPHGPFWVNAQRQLCTFMENGVISVSDEYEASLLAQIDYSYLSQIEVGYLLDKTSLTDEIVIMGFDSNGNPVTVVHDFTLADDRSEHGQGYQYQYTSLTLNCFVGAGFTPRQNVFDTSGQMRLWAGSTQGFFAQLEDGLSDNTSTFAGDYISLISLGNQRRSLIEMEYQGDPDFQFSYLTDYSLTLKDFIAVTQDQIPENVQQSTRFGVKFGGEEARWLYFRAQLTSHPADGNYALTNPPFLPMPSYGAINMTDLKLGAARPEGR